MKNDFILKLVEFNVALLTYLGTSAMGSTQIYETKFPQSDENVKLTQFPKTIYLPIEVLKTNLLSSKIIWDYSQKLNLHK